MLQKKILLSLVVATLPFSVGVAYAENISISHNGDGSSSTITVESDKHDTAEQTNNASINNSIDTQSTTGDNSASNNDNSSSVQSGDSHTSTDVTNTVNNSQALPGNCCVNQDNSIAVTGNGDNSTNTTTINSSLSNQASINNHATIVNTISGNANTGGNTANKNTGNVKVITGNIDVHENVTNSINHSVISIPSPTSNGFSVIISGNGIGSVNNVSLTQDTNAIVTVNNVADILNLNFWNLVTGNNTTNGNSGDVMVKTGDIHSNINITNDVNSNTVKLDCGCSPTPPPPPPCKENCTPATPPPTTSSTTPGPSGSGGTSGPGSVLGTTTALMLPATGMPWMLVAILGNLLMLFFGLVLRLRSGRSPGLIS